MYKNRFYREQRDNDLISFEVKIAETDILFLAQKNLSREAEFAVQKHRNDIEEYIKQNPLFQTSLVPLDIRGAEYEGLPEIIKRMLDASRKTGVGPMAGVAGAIAEFSGMDLLPYSNEIIAENGGDVFIKSSVDRVFGIFAGASPLSGKIAIRVKADDTPLGVSTSSGSVSHSLSFGRADAAVIIAKDTVLSDAAATAVCNIAKTENDIEKALNFSKTIEGVMGSVIIYGNKMGSIGNVELI